MNITPQCGNTGGVRFYFFVPVTLVFHPSFFLAFSAKFLENSETMCYHNSVLEKIKKHNERDNKYQFLSLSREGGYAID